jgi:hypothetical protein
MISVVIMGLIELCMIALAIYLILWVLQTVVGIALPAQVINIIWVIVALFAVLYLVTKVLPQMGIRVGSAEVTWQTS